MKLPFSDFIVFVAPFPQPGKVVEGWQSRIRAVDAIFGNERRIYLNFDEALAMNGEIGEERHGEHIIEYRVNPMDEAHRELVRTAISAARLAYVHTVHWARYVLLLYPCGKLVTDFHGIVPEEEAMLGRPETGAFYEVIERFVLMNSATVVVVSDEMREHLRRKYPTCSADFITMPIIENYALGLEDRINRADNEKPRVIYSGAAQAWQNIDLMLEICRQSLDFYGFRFISHDYQLIRTKAEGLAIADAMTFEVRNKEEMPTVYLNADYGFVLREDVAVNRVACPTKLSEYMQFGVIPVVKLVDIGDLGAEGYAYVTHEEFAAGVVPESSIADEMRRHNKAIIDRIERRFEDAARRLRMLATSQVNRFSRFADIFESSRYLIFPNHADFYAFSDPLRYGRKEVVEAYRAIEIALDRALPALLYRFVPIMADCRLVIKRLVIAHDANDPPAAIKSIHISGEPLNGSWMLRKDKPHIDIETAAPIRVVQFKADVEFIGIGPSLDRMTMDRSQERGIRPIEIELTQEHNVRRDRLTPTAIA